MRTSIRPIGQRLLNRLNRERHRLRRRLRRSDGQTVRRSARASAHSTLIGRRLGRSDDAQTSQAILARAREGRLLRPMEQTSQRTVLPPGVGRLHTTVDTGGAAPTECTDARRPYPMHRRPDADGAQLKSASRADYYAFGGSP